MPEVVANLRNELKLTWDLNADRDTIALCIRTTEPMSPELLAEISYLVGSINRIAGRWNGAEVPVEPEA